MKRIIGLVLIFVNIISMLAAASDEKKNENKYIDLGEVIITATKSEKSQKDIASSVSVVKQNDIKSTDSKSCTEVLNKLPGVFVHKTGDFGRADVAIRGLGDKGTRLAVLVDGKPMKMGLFGCSVTHELPLNNVEKIEVVRGASSVLYGSDAMGGVVNIITKKPKGKFETSIDLSYGSFRTQDYQIQHGGNLDNFYYYASGDYRISDGHVSHSSYDGKDYSAMLGYKVSGNLDISARGKYFKAHKDEPLRVDDPAGTIPNVWNNYERGAGDLTADFSFEGWKGYLKTYTILGEHIFSDGWYSRDYSYGSNLNSVGKLFSDNELTMGLDYRLQTGERFSAPSGNWKKHEYAVYMIDQHTFFNSLMVSAGARYHIDQYAGEIIVPQFSSVYHFSSDTSVRGVLSRGFRAPQLTELYLFPPSNSSLTYELNWNYEIGINQKVMNGLGIDLSGFVMKGDNLIEVVKGKYRNAGSFEFKGLETILNFPAFDNFGANLSYSYLFTGEKTTGRPQSKFDLGINYNLNGLNLYLNSQCVLGYYASDNYADRIDNYFVTNIKADYEFAPGINAFAAINNIFNREYGIYADLPSNSGVYEMPKFNVNAGVGMKF